MKHEKIYLSTERNAYFNTYFIENSIELKPNVLRPVVIVCPGGGYCFLSDREAELIALKYVSNGYHAVVLNYGINEHAVMPGPIKDLADTIAYLRTNSNDLYINPDQIYVSGFSAGGHVAASIGVFWNNPDILPEYANKSSLIKPNGMILGYSVLDLRSSSTHLDIGIQPNTDIEDIEFGQIHPNINRKDIFVLDNDRYFVDFEKAMNAYIFGGNYTDEQEDYYSLQNQVSPDTPPTFLWHTATDGLILPTNSMLFASKLQQYKVPFELHIFGNGDHGLSLANNVSANYPHEIVPECQVWIDLALAWLNKRTGANTLGGETYV